MDADARAGGNLRRVLDAAARAHAEAGAALALVLETEGSTYVRPGAMALFGATAGQVGWLSGGCLEPEIARRAMASARTGRIGWLDIDTRDDEDLFSGSALGCRGRLRIALLPLAAMPGIDGVLDAWHAGGVALDIALSHDGALELRVPTLAKRWRLAVDDDGWTEGRREWSLRIAPAPAALVFGAGPETPVLLPLLRDLGWRTTLVERRERWRGLAALADRHLDATPTDAAATVDADVALVMHHNFELDREALAALAAGGIGFIGLLGPVRRREDLFRVLSTAQRDAVSARLRSPIGLKLGGHGPEAIALSIAAQLQAWRSGEAVGG